MTLALPKQMRALVDREITLVELNDTDIERMLPHIFGLAIKGGRVGSVGRVEGGYASLVEQLRRSPMMQGFDSDRGRAVLDGWLRSSVVVIGRAGRTRAQEAMQYVRPLTLGSYAAGLPIRSRHRGADGLAYDIMVTELKARGDGRGSAVGELRERFVAAIGDGVAIGESPTWTPRYDGVSELDINALLELYFLEGFPESRPARDRGKDTLDSPIPAATSALGKDLADYLLSYGHEVAPALFATHFSALLGLRLFQLPLRVARTLRSLLNGGHISEDLTNPDSYNPLEQYCDFTAQRGSASDEMARACVQRDLDALRGFFHDRVMIRILNEASDSLPNAAELRAMNAVDRLVALVEASSTLPVEAYATMSLNIIDMENRDSTSNDANPEFMDQLRATDRSQLEKAAIAIVEGNRKRAYENQVKWFWSTGGIKSEVGILAGTLGTRRTAWSYGPRDALLTALVATAFVGEGGKVGSTMPISRLLEIFDHRFGILIDRAPSDMNTAENRAAASANLTAFKRRLQLLGCFDSLSDDFTAQHVRNPLRSGT